jgi:hypothetical protein
MEPRPIDGMGDEPMNSSGARWTAKAKFRLGPSLFALYALSIGPAHWIASRTGYSGFLVVYRPLVHAAEPLGNVHYALSCYVHLFVDSCTAP